MTWMAAFLLRKASDGDNFNLHGPIRLKDEKEILKENFSQKKESVSLRNWKRKQ